MKKLKIFVIFAAIISLINNLTLLLLVNIIPEGSTIAIGGIVVLFVTLIGCYKGTLAVVKTDKKFHPLLAGLIISLGIIPFDTLITIILTAGQVNFGGQMVLWGLLGGYMAQRKIQNKTVIFGWKG